MELERTVNKALAKRLDERYQTVTDLMSDLRRHQRISTTATVQPSPLGTQSTVERPVRQWAGVAALVLIVTLAVVFLPRLFAPSKKPPISERKMLVVLPFENLGSPEDEYFADGITEEITSRLAEIDGLGVIARTSALQYKHTDMTIQQIGEELGVEYLLEGTVRWEKPADGESRVRVTPQLIRVSDATHIWTERYDAVLAGIFKIQSDIAERVTRALDITLLEPERLPVKSRPTENLEAYDYYLRGNNYVERRYDEHDCRIAIQMYEKAVELDPTFAQAWSQLSYAHAMLYWFHWDRTAEVLLKAREAADKALVLSADLPEAHRALGYYYYWGHLDYDRALEQFGIAQKTQPNNTDLLAAIGYVQRRQGRFELALGNLKKALELDPRSARLAYHVGETCDLLRNYAEADRHYDRAISLSPDWARPYWHKALFHLRWKGSTEKARAVLEQASRNVGSREQPLLSFTLVVVDVFDGNYQGALDRLSSVSSEAFETQYYFVPKAQLYAQIYGLMNRPQLEQAYYDSARSSLQTLISEQPQDARLHSSLGIAYAGLGRKEEALRSGKLAVDILPVSKEAWRGLYRVEDLARIYVMVREYDLAIDQLEFLLSIPGEISVPMLHLDPRWDPLHNHPRFQRLIEKYSEVES